jgi:DNA-binding NarL/FixJ family response regulator
MLMRALQIHPPDTVVLNTRSGVWDLNNVISLLRGVCDARVIALASDEDAVLSTVRREGVCVVGTKVSAAEFLKMLSIDSDEPEFPVANSQDRPTGSGLDRQFQGDGLTNRQKEVFRMLVTGMPIKAIAHSLRISPRTVEFHKYRVMAALGVSSMAELVRYGVEAGIVYESEPANVSVVLRSIEPYVDVAGAWG